jgi:serine/threonine protein phosphatase PrpC
MDVRGCREGVHCRRIKFYAAARACARRALGDPEYKLKGGSCAVIAAPEVRRLRLRPGDAAVVLASDGLFDVMDDGEVVDVIEQARLQSVERGTGLCARKSWAMLWEPDCPR